VCLALDYAHHEGVVHRDLKPTNIILERTGSQPQFIPKIVDFGIAKVNLQEETALTQIGEMLGTPLYMSPEQCAGELVDSKSDIYSLGCVIFECLTGTPPFSGKNSLVTMMMHRHNEPPSMKEASMGLDFPRPMETIISKMLAKNPQDRYSSCMAIAQDFEYLKRGETQKVGPVSQKNSQSVASKNTSKLTLTVSVVVAFALLITAGILVMLFKTSVLSVPSATSPPSPTSPTSPTSVASPTSTASNSPTTAASTNAGLDLGGPDSADHIERSFCRMVSRQRQYEFPNENQIGTLYWWTKGASKSGWHKACGSFSTPADAKPLLDMGTEILFNKASYLTGFADDFLYGAFVKIPPSWMVFGNDNALTRSLKLLENQSKSLRILQLGSRHVNRFSFSEAQLSSLNQLTRIEWLIIDSALSAEELIKFDVFPRLKVLAIRHTKNCGLIIDKLRLSKNITRLSISDCLLTERDLQVLSHLRTLRMLELRELDVLGYENCTRTDALKYVANLPDLEQLCIDGWNVIDPLELKEIAKMKKLKVMTIPDDTVAPNFVPAMVASIRSKLPNCKVELMPVKGREYTVQEWCDPVKTNPANVISWE
jgi:hypothetical protein